MQNWTSGQLIGELWSNLVLAKKVWSEHLSNPSLKLVWRKCNLDNSDLNVTLVLWLSCCRSQFKLFPTNVKKCRCLQSYGNKVIPTWRCRYTLSNCCLVKVAAGWVVAGLGWSSIILERTLMTFGPNQRQCDTSITTITMFSPLQFCPNSGGISVSQVIHCVSCCDDSMSVRYMLWILELWTAVNTITCEMTYPTRCSILKYNREAWPQVPHWDCQWLLCCSLMAKKNADLWLAFI